MVARCHKLRNSEKMRKAGAHALVSPDFTGGLGIASAMIRPHVLTFLDQMPKSEENLRVAEVIVAAGFSEQPLAEPALSSRAQIVLAIREGEHWTFNPEPAHRIRAGMTFVIMATPEGRKLFESAGPGLIPNDP